MFQVVKVPMTGTNLDLDSIRFESPVVESNSLGEHADHTLTCFLGADKCRDIVVRG